MNTITIQQATAAIEAMLADWPAPLPDGVEAVYRDARVASLTKIIGLNDTILWQAQVTPRAAVCHMSLGDLYFQENERGQLCLLSTREHTANIPRFDDSIEEAKETEVATTEECGASSVLSPATRALVALYAACRAHYRRCGGLFPEALRFLVSICGKTVRENIEQGSRIELSAFCRRVREADLHRQPDVQAAYEAALHML